MRVVTIDGPAGAGKSAAARRVAARLGWRLLDTGAMYRAVTLAALRERLDLTSDRALGDLVDRLRVTLPPEGVLLDGEDVSLAIRDLEVTRASSLVADSRLVRARLVDWQRSFAAEHDTITEGRDQGTIVFPDAFLKFYVTATADERARRRHRELLARGDDVTLERVLQDITERDTRDAARAIAPLRPAPDAISIDTTGLTLEQVVSRLLDVIDSRIEEHPGECRDGN
jgi:cytidylate kinase